MARSPAQKPSAKLTPEQTHDEARRIATNITKLPVFNCCDAIFFNKGRSGFGNDLVSSNS